MTQEGGELKKVVGEGGSWKEAVQVSQESVHVKKGVGWQGCMGQGVLEVWVIHNELLDWSTL